MEDRESFVDGDPYQPTPESALAIKCRDTVKCREQALFYGNISSVKDCLARGVRQNGASGDIATPEHKKSFRLSAEACPSGIASFNCSFKFNVGHTFALLPELLLGHFVFAAQLSLEVRHPTRPSIPRPAARYGRLERMSRGRTPSNEAARGSEFRSAPVSV